MKVSNLPRHSKNILLGLLVPSARPCNIASFHLGRSGSTLLGDLLKQHPRVVWEGEVLSPGRLSAFADRWPRLSSDPMRLLKLRMLMSGTRCYGFETQPTQVELLGMELEEYADRLERLGFHRFLLLERKNHLRRIVSMLVGRSSSRWHVKSGDAARPARIALDVEQLWLGRGKDTGRRSLAAHLQREQEIMSKLKRALSGRRFLHLTYEDDLAAQPEAAYRRVCEFAGLDHHDVSVRLGRTNPFALRDIVVNFSEVERALRGTPFEWMLQA